MNAVEGFAGTWRCGKCFEPYGEDRAAAEACCSLTTTDETPALDFTELFEADE